MVGGCLHAAGEAFDKAFVIKGVRCGLGEGCGLGIPKRAAAVSSDAGSAWSAEVFQHLGSVAEAHLEFNQSLEVIDACKCPYSGEPFILDCIVGDFGGQECARIWKSTRAVDVINAGFMAVLRGAAQAWRSSSVADM